MRSLLTLSLLVAACTTAPKNTEVAPEAKAVDAARKVDGNILRIFHTSDEHGWFEGRYSKSHDVRTGGFEHAEPIPGKDHGFDRDLDVLVSSGDSWTGRR